VVRSHWISRSRALLALALLLAGTPAGACPVPSGGTADLAAAPPEARLAFLRETLSRESRHVYIWSSAWIGANGLLIAGTAGLIPFYPRSSRVDLVIGTGATTIAALPFVILPPSVQRDGPRFEENLAALKPGTDLCAIISEGERMLIRDAGEEKAILGPLATIINLIYNVGVALVFGLGFNRWLSGGSAMISGFAIGEFVMFTQPKALPLDLDRYLEGHITNPAAKPGVSLMPAPAGLGLTLTF
jgi:hypothetical protein